jgi:HK97 family phage major capsid protein
MTLAQMRAAAQARLESAQAVLRVAEDRLTTLRSLPDGHADLTTEAVLAARTARDTARAAVTPLQAEVEDLDAEIARAAADDAAQRETVPNANAAGNPAAARAPNSVATITREPTTYERGGNASYFRDITAVNLNREGYRGAMERLERNQQEVRALTTVDGAGGDFVPPVWLVNQFVELARAGRIVADQIAQQPLPAGTDTIILPRLATGTAVAEQATQNTAVQNTDATTNNISASVATIAGQQVVAVQLLEQSPINMDEVLLADLAADYAIKLDTYVINNNAAGKLGLLNVASTNAAAITATTATGLYAAVANGIQLINTNRFMPADKIFMHPRRWAMLLAAVDTQGRPLVVPYAGAMNGMADPGANVAQGFVGSLQGLPVFVDPNIPTNLGAGTNEDRVIIVRSTDSILYEGNLRSEAFRETKADQLSVLLRVYNYAAIHASRLPKSISVLAGVGLVPPTF